MESGHRFDAQTLHSFIQAVFRQMGSEEQEAKLVADHLIAANLAGHDSHGIGMIPSYVRSWSQGHLQINHHAKTVKEAGAAVTLDGDRAFGQVAAHEAMALGIEKAHQHGIEERCVACNLCAVACPVGCISLQKAETKDGRWYPEFFRINFSRCIFCGLCEEACPTTAIQLTPDFEMGEYKRQDLVYEKEDLLISGPGKYPEYNFYRMAGMAIDGKDKGEAENEAKPIDVKSLLP